MAAVRSFLLAFVAIALVALPTVLCRVPGTVDQENAILVEATITRANTSHLAPAVVNTLQGTTEWSVETKPGAGWVKAAMITAINTACFLTYSEYWSTNTQAGCAVIYDPSTLYWYLYAYSGNTQSSAWCKSRCVQWS